MALYVFIKATVQARKRHFIIALAEFLTIGNVSDITLVFFHNDSAIAESAFETTENIGAVLLVELTVGHYLLNRIHISQNLYRLVYEDARD